MADCLPCAHRSRATFIKMVVYLIAIVVVIDLGLTSFIVNLSPYELTTYVRKKYLSS